MSIRQKAARRKVAGSFAMGEASPWSFQTLFSRWYGWLASADRTLRTEMQRPAGTAGLIARESLLSPDPLEGWYDNTYVARYEITQEQRERQVSPPSGSIERVHQPQALESCEAPIQRDPLAARLHGQSRMVGVGHQISEGFRLAA